MAQFQSIVRGVSMLARPSLTAVEAEYCRNYEKVTASTTITRSLEDLLKQNPGKTVAPAGNYMDLKLMIGTYCGLLWSTIEDGA